MGGHGPSQVLQGCNRLNVRITIANGDDSRRRPARTTPTSLLSNIIETESNPHPSSFSLYLLLTPSVDCNTNYGRRIMDVSRQLLTPRLNKARRALMSMAVVFVSYY